MAEIQLSEMTVDDEGEMLIEFPRIIFDGDRVCIVFIVRPHGWKNYFETTGGVTFDRVLIQVPME